MNVLEQAGPKQVNNQESVFDRYTEAARRAIYFARMESQRRGDMIITVADLLAGLSVDEDTRADRIASLKANGFYLRWLSGLPALPARASDSSQPGYEARYEEHLQQTQLDLDTDAKRAFVFALMEADRDREYWIDSDHLLRGLLRFPNKAHFAVLKIEVNLHAARVGSRQDREEFIPDETPNLKVLKYLLRKYVARWAPSTLSLACYLYILIQSIGMSAASVAK
jgi:hypothetical protein